MSTETRYADLLNRRPTGPFYASQGLVIPYKNTPTTLRLLTQIPNEKFLIVVNDVQSGFVDTDINGNAIFDVLLPLGNIIIELFRQNSTDKIIGFVTTRQYSVWYGAAAEQIETIDDAIDLTFNASRLQLAKSGDIEIAHGTRLLTPNDFNGDLEAYREALQFIWQAFRQYGGRLSGKMAAVAAITQVNPLIFDRSETGPRWILGFDVLTNGALQDASRPLGSADLATQLNVAGAFVQLVGSDAFVNVGTGTLTYHRNFKRFVWTVPIASTIGVTPPRKYDGPAIVSNGGFDLPSGMSQAFIEALHEPITLASSFQDYLYVDIDGHGIIPVRLTPYFGPITRSMAFNAHVRASIIYDGYRKASTQPVGSLANFVEVVKVYNDTVFNTALDSGTGTIDFLGGTNFQYTPPLGGPGPITSVVPGALNTLTGGGSPSNKIDVFISYVMPGGPTSDTFTITRRYHNTVATMVSGGDQLQINSQHFYPADGTSKITIHDGPASAAREVLGIPKLVAGLSNTVFSGSPTIEMPAGTALLFNGISNQASLPFDVVVGHGWSSAQTTTWTMTPDANPKTSVISGLSGIQFKKGNTHVLLNVNSTVDASRISAVHQILSINEILNTAILSYSGLILPQLLSTIFGIKIIGVDPSTPDGTASFNYTSGPPRLAYKAPGDAFFGGVTNYNVGHTRFVSNNGKFFDAITDPASAGATISGTAAVTRGFVPYVATGSDILRIWSQGERARVVSVAPNGLTEIWTLQDTIAGEYAVGMEVFLADHQPPFTISGPDSFGKLSINANPAFEPPLAINSANIPVGEPGLPSGWLNVTGSPVSFQMRPDGKFNTSSLFVDNSSGNVVFEGDVPIIDKESMCGSIFTIKAWVRNRSATDNFSETFILGFDFGSGIVEGTGNLVTDPDLTVRHPQLIQFSTIFPPNATKFKIRIRRSSGFDVFSVERVAVIQNRFSSLFLGDGTTPRDNGRAFFGSLFYIWSPDPLLTQEKSLIGVSAPVTSGLLSEIHNAHEQVDAFDVTDVFSGDITNVRGAIDEPSWLLATLTNMSVVSRTPSRFSYVKPTRESAVFGEQLQFSIIPPFTANLYFICDQDQTNSVLYENGIPVPNDQWAFTNATEVQILTGFNPGAVYIIDYQILIRAETAPIDLQVPYNNGMDTWFADYVIWNRQLSDILKIKSNISVNFGVDYTAQLPLHSDQNKTTSVLSEDLGTTRRIIPQTSWSYIDSLFIRISGGEFSPDAIYSIEYNQQITDSDRVVNVKAEIRSSNSIFGLSTAAYSEFNINECVNSNLRFHQIRMTFSNVIKMDDIRLHSAVLKGLNMAGVGSPPPGFSL